ncbi:Type I restriction enzyme R protein N terminus (HSDR_N) [Candidatus Electrothrix aarhusensis]
MTDIELLDQMIKDEAKMVLEEKNGKLYVTLKEPQYPKGSVTIAGMPNNSIVIKADKFNSPDSLFAGSKGECKRADFIIAAATAQKKVILCIEMKYRKGKPPEIVQQLRGTRCLLSYCQEIGRAFWDKQDFLKGYAYRFISIGNLSIAKQKTRIERQSAKHDCPERMLKIDWPNSRIEFNRLSGKV